MSSPATSHTLPATSTQSSDDVLVRVEGVSKKFCRSLKKSLWYEVCDIAGELNPFRRRVAEVASSGSRVTGKKQRAGVATLATSNSPLVSTEASLRSGKIVALSKSLGRSARIAQPSTLVPRLPHETLRPSTSQKCQQARTGAFD